MRIDLPRGVTQNTAEALLKISRAALLREVLLYKRIDGRVSLGLLRRGLATFTEESGWLLTDLGKEVLKAVNEVWRVR